MYVTESQNSPINLTYFEQSPTPHAAAYASNQNPAKPKPLSLIKPFAPQYTVVASAQPNQAHTNVSLAIAPATTVQTF